MVLKKQTLKLLNINKLEPNEWNPNIMQEEDYNKLRASILFNGFTQPIKVAPKKDGNYIIIDGEHRYKILIDLFEEFQKGSLKYSVTDIENNILDHFMTSGEIPCIVLSGYTEAELKVETLNSNYLGGDPEPYKTGEMLALIQERIENSDKIVGFSKNQVNDYLEIFKEPKEDIIKAKESIKEMEQERPILYKFKINGEIFTFVVTGQTDKELIDKALKLSKGIDDNFRFYNICKFFVESVEKSDKKEG